MKAGPYQAGRRPGPSSSSRPQASSSARGANSPEQRARQANADTPKCGTSGSNAGSPPSPGSAKRASAPPSQDGSRRWTQQDASVGGQSLSRVSSFSDGKRDDQLDLDDRPREDHRGLFYIIEQLAALEGALYSILDGLKSNATHVSYFCREYWGTSASQAQLSLERLSCNERLKRQVQQACVLEGLSLAVASHLCSGVMQGVSVTIRSRLRNLLYYVHENCLVLLDMVCQRWHAENPNIADNPTQSGHCPENLNLDIMVRVKRYRRLRKGEHIMALRQHNEMIANVARQLCRGAASKRAPLSSRGVGSPGDRSPGVRGPGGSSSQKSNVLAAVNDLLSARMPLDRLRASSIRGKMMQFMRFKPLLNVDGSDPDCPWPFDDPYNRYGAEHFAQEGPVIWFEPLPPMLPNLEHNPKLPAAQGGSDVWTLVLDLDETLIHYSESDGMGSYAIRPGMHEFLERMSALGYEIVIFTAATQDYADWVIDQIDENKHIHHRLYRQHALPWGPIFVKDLSRLGRDLDRTLIIDNVQENFMLQPHHGIFIATWYEDPQDTALFQLTPLLAELIQSRGSVPDVLEKYRDQIPTWAGFDAYSQYVEECDNFDTDEDMLDEVDTEPTLAPTLPKYSPAAGAGGGQSGAAISYSSSQQPTQLPAGVESTGGFSSQVSSAAGTVRQEASPPSSPPIGGMRSALPPPISMPQYHAQGRTRPGSEYQRVVESPMGSQTYVAAELPARQAAAAPTGSQSSASSYTGQPYSQRKPQQGYPPSANVIPPGAVQQQQIHSSAVRQMAQQMAGQARPQRSLVPAQAASPHSAPTGPQRAAVVSAAAPQLQMRPPAPAFSSAGGPSQAAAPPQGTRPQAAAMWGRTGLGPHQAPPMRR